jgi:hypothetical protein
MGERDLRVGHLPLARLPAQLEKQLDQLREARRARRMAPPHQASVRICRKLAAYFEMSFAQ